MEVNNTNQQVLSPQQSPPGEIIASNPSSHLKKIVLVFAILFVLVASGIGSYYLTVGKNQPISQKPPQLTTQPSVAPSTTTTLTKVSNEIGSIFLAPKSGIPFDVIIKSAKANVLGDSTAPQKNIPIQIFAFEDHNGNGVREPDDNALGFIPVNIYDSPFSDTPVNKINSTDSGWASVVVQTSEPYQLVVNPVPTKDYYPTTKPIIVSERNNFAVVGFEKKQSETFHISVFAFEDANKDSNFNYDDKNEKPLFLAPFKFYQQYENGQWNLLPNSVNSTDTGWATTTLEVKYPYVIKVEAGDLSNLTPSNKEITTNHKDATLIFPYISN